MWSAHRIECSESKIVHLNPDGTLPVVLPLAELRVRRGQAAETIRRPEVLWITQHVENGTQVGRVGREQSEQEGE